jgi:hypothetical protein
MAPQRVVRSGTNAGGSLTKKKEGYLQGGTQVGVLGVFPAEERHAGAREEYVPDARGSRASEQRGQKCAERGRVYSRRKNMAVGRPRSGEITPAVRASLPVCSWTSGQPSAPPPSPLEAPRLRWAGLSDGQWRRRCMMASRADRSGGTCGSAWGRAITSTHTAPATTPASLSSYHSPRVV